ncbi:MAG TPA: DoxX family protein [Micromonosporaceae bacterium]|nr:DoxX family protein [Micromonosporaceae bacterium]
MFVATVVVSGLLAALLAVTAIRKLSHREPVVRSYARVGVPEDKLNYLAAVLLAGAAGLILGLWWAALGVAAAIGLVCYFLAAIGAHVRAHDARNLPTPVVVELLAIAALVLRVATI